jgi:hypothetical protein
MLTPAQLREGSRRANELALKEATPHLRQALAAHALDLAHLAERLERTDYQDTSLGSEMLFPK